MSVRVRFAPSPTGHLHIGGLRTALFNELFARHNDGQFLLRIEDTDIERSRAEYTEAIMQAFAWTKVHFDQEPVIQSTRIEEHKKILDQLIQEGKAYFCTCAPEEVLERNRTKYNTDSIFANRYDRYCLNRQHELGAQPAAIRFKLPFEQGPITFNDLIKGDITIDADQLDDFIIARSDGTPMYNFVVVLDDHFMEITHVIRGEEHLANTPKQILLYQACSYAIPQFAHVPMILGPSGDKLSKRDGAMSVLEYRQLGYIPEALVNYLVRLGWAHGDQEIFTKQELINYFSLEHVSRHGAKFDQEKLDWLNGVYIRQKTPVELLTIIERDIDPLFQAQTINFSYEQRITLVGLYQQRANTLAEIARAVIAVHNPPTQFDQESLHQWISSTTTEYLDRVVQILEQTDSFTVELVSHAIKQLSKELNIKLVSIVQPVRIALIGTSSGPGVFELMGALGKQESIGRIRNLQKKLA